MSCLRFVFYMWKRMSIDYFKTILKRIKLNIKEYSEFIKNLLLIIVKL